MRLNTNQAPLRVLVTAGGTVEPIDQVRGITNTSTGRLGAALADAFAVQGACVRFLHGVHSAMPQNESISRRAVGSVDDALAGLQAWLHEVPADVVVHAMAVSDFRVARVCAADGQVLQADGKLASSHTGLVLHLEPTPKLLAGLRALCPQACLVAFKLLSGVELPALFAAAQNLRARHACDFVVANRLEDVEPNHQAWLLDGSGVVEAFASKPAIAEGVVRHVQRFAGRDREHCGL